MLRAEMQPSPGFHFVYVIDDGMIHSEEMLPHELLFVIEDLMNENASLRESLREEQRGFLSFLRRRK